VLPPGSTPRGGAGTRTAQVLQCHLGGILLGVVDILPVIPVSSRDVLTLNGHGAGPSGASAFFTLNQKISQGTDRTWAMPKMREISRSIPRLSETIWKTGG
jgi:hypothetical protein